MTTLYKRQGRRYVAWGHAEHYNQDLLRAGQWRLSYCPRDGHTRYAYDVRPDTAGFVAAAELARDAMEQAIQQRAAATFQPGAVPYTKKQLEALENARKYLAEAGVLMPQWWEHATARELSEAGIEAVRGWEP